MTIEERYKAIEESKQRKLQKEGCRVPRKNSPKDESRKKRYRREYMRKYRAKNKEKIMLYNRLYRASLSEEQLERYSETKRKYNEEHADKIKAYQQKYRAIRRSERYKPLYD